MTNWSNTGSVVGKRYICGFCGNCVGPSIGYTKDNFRHIHICPKCDQPTFFNGDKQTPAPLLGNEVKSVPEDINSLYNEARACTGVGAFTAAVLACRKLLMHIAVDKVQIKGSNSSNMWNT
jgi:hypothetical protein